MPLSRGYTSDFLLAPVMRFFSNFVRAPAREGGYTCDKFWRQIEGHISRDSGTINRRSSFNFIGQILFSRVASAGKKLQGGYTGNYLCDFVAKVSTLATFFLRFFHLSRRQFKGGYTCDFHRALATQQISKNHSCSRGFSLLINTNLHICRIGRVVAALVS